MWKTSFRIVDNVRTSLHDSIKYHAFFSFAWPPFLVGHYVYCRGRSIKSPMKTSCWVSSSPVLKHFSPSCLLHKWISPIIRSTFFIFYASIVCYCPIIASISVNMKVDLTHEKFCKKSRTLNRLLRHLKLLVFFLQWIITLPFYTSIPMITVNPFAPVFSNSGRFGSSVVGTAGFL